MTPANPGDAARSDGRCGLVTWRVSRPGAARYREHALKRPFDVLLSSIGLVVASPLFALVAVAVKIEDGGPVFYAQERVGLGGRSFRLLKFRSMIPDAEAKTGPVWAADGDPRVTRVGRILRRTAADELPQLLNILRGDISFVGPRSHRKVFADRFDAEVRDYARRYEMRPGLTGLAQLFARYDSSALQKLRFDLLYMRGAGPLLDLKIVGASFLVTFLGRWDQRRGRKLDFLHRFIALGAPGRPARTPASWGSGNGRPRPGSGPGDQRPAGLTPDAPEPRVQ
jgi:lipopolysaccharide/colanic/teichoic acid biosynthesis glycosyltransferase